MQRRRDKRLYGVHGRRKPRPCDEEDWKDKVTVKFIQTKRGKRDEIASLDEDIEVTGILKKGRQGTKLLRVTNYKPLENRGYDPEDGDYEYDSEKDLDSGGEPAKSSAGELAKFPALLNFMKQTN